MGRRDERNPGQELLRNGEATIASLLPAMSLKQKWENLGRVGLGAGSDGHTVVVADAWIMLRLSEGTR